MAGFMLAGVLISQPAKAAGVFSDCDIADGAGYSLGMITMVASCDGTLQTRLYNAAASVNNNNAEATVAQLGLLQLESGCGTNRSNVTQASCEGIYNVKAGNSSAYGATQILSGTWSGIVTNSGTKNYMIQQLGGCGSTPASGSLLDPAREPDSINRAQFAAFRASLCGQSSPYCSADRKTPASCKPVTNQSHWGSMAAVSVLVANAYSATSKGSVGSNVNSALSNIKTTSGSSINSYGVTQYAIHNLGSGGGPKFLNALASNPNASMSSVANSCVIGCNTGLYCANGGSGTQKCGSNTCKVCSSPLNLSQAAQRMNNAFAGSSCVQKALASYQQSGKQLNGELPAGGLAGDGVVPTASNTITAISTAEFFQESGGAAGEYETEADNYRCESQVSPAMDSPEALQACLNTAK